MTTTTTKKTIAIKGRWKENKSLCWNEPQHLGRPSRSFVCSMSAHLAVFSGLFWCLHLCTDESSECMGFRCTSRGEGQRYSSPFCPHSGHTFGSSIVPKEALGADWQTWGTTTKVINLRCPVSSSKHMLAKNVDGCVGICCTGHAPKTVESIGEQHNKQQQDAGTWRRAAEKLVIAKTLPSIKHDAVCACFYVCPFHNCTTHIHTSTWTNAWLHTHCNTWQKALTGNNRQKKILNKAYCISCLMALASRAKRRIAK